MRVEVRGVHLWFDVSGPSVVVEGDSVRERPTLVAVHGGPGLDHTGLKDTLAPVTDDAQVLFYDQRGHGRSDYSSPEYWNLRTWAADLRDLCGAVGLDHPIVLGSSFGGFVALAYAGLYADHPGGLILASTTGGRVDHERTIEVFQRLGGAEAAAAARRDFTELSEESAEEFNRVCYPLFSARPGFAEESRQRLRRSIRTTQVNLHYWRHEAVWFDPWDLLPQITCPVLVLAGADDPMCPIGLVEELAAGLTGASRQLVRLDGARHAVFRDQPDAAFAAVRRFIQSVTDGRQHRKPAQQQ